MSQYENKNQNLSIAPGEQGTFNGAIAYLYELTVIKRKLHELRLTKKYADYFLVIEAYYFALSCRIKNVELRKKLKNQYEESKKISSYIEELLENNAKTIDSNCIYKLKEFELDLRECENELGLIMPNKSDPSVALGGVSY